MSLSPEEKEDPEMTPCKEIIYVFVASDISVTQLSIRILKTNIKENNPHLERQELPVLDRQNL